jgi:hypothetical protein
MIIPQPVMGLSVQSRENRSADNLITFPAYYVSREVPDHVVGRRLADCCLPERLLPFILVSGIYWK